MGTHKTYMYNKSWQRLIREGKTYCVVGNMHFKYYHKTSQLDEKVPRI